MDKKEIEMLVGESMEDMGLEEHFDKELQKVECLSCGKEFEMVLRYCCDGDMCACLGLSIDLIVCGEYCYDEYIYKYRDKRVK